jgi:carbamoyltransferase
VLAERASEVFDIDVESPYMMLVAEVREGLRTTDGHRSEDLRAWVNEVRSELPAITHVDFSARLQTVDATRSPRFHAILSAFERLTGCPVLINTSFNVRGEPIVCTPEDAYRCFMRTEMDHLVLGGHLLDKTAQPGWTEDARWQEDLVLD